MRKKLTLDDLRIESFETTAPSALRGTVVGMETEIISGCASGNPECPDYTNGCGGAGPSDSPCTWYAVATCESNQIAFPSECTGCGVDCNPSFDYCASGPGYHC
jgi:hypothetical protein